MLRLALALLVGLTTPAFAQPVPYRLDTDRTTVAFIYTLNGDAVTGELPIIAADLSLDFRTVARSSVAVTLSAAQAKGGLPFATTALRGADMLDAANHPEIRFVARAIRGDVNAATVTGDLTMAGVTRPITLTGGLFRQAGTEAGDLSRITVLLRGSVNRRDFGMDGFPALVGEPVTIEIRARADRDG